MTYSKEKWIKARIKYRIIQIIISVGVTSADTNKNTQGESFLSTVDWRWGTKVRIGNRIRYPDTSHCQRWMVVVSFNKNW
jgi:hypothetical protein